MISSMLREVYVYRLLINMFADKLYFFFSFLFAPVDRSKGRLTASHVAIICIYTKKKKTYFYL